MGTWEEGGRSEHALWGWSLWSGGDSVVCECVRGPCIYRFACVNIGKLSGVDFWGTDLFFMARTMLSCVVAAFALHDHPVREELFL